MKNFFIEEDNMNNNNNKLFEGNLLNDSDNLSISSNEFNEIFLKKNNQTNFESSYSNSIILINKKKKREEDKKLRLKKNAESAKKSRLKKKLEFENLIKENLLLKNKISELKLKINYCLCENCKKIFELDKKAKLFISENVSSNKIINNNNNINNNINNKSIFFTTTIFIFICLFFIFKSNDNIFVQNNLRNLSNSMKSKFSLKIEEIIKNKLSIKDIYLTCSDYFSIINSHNYFLNNERQISFENIQNLKIIDENSLYSENITYENCLDYFIRINNFNYNLSIDRKKHLQLTIIPSKKINNFTEFKNQNNLENNGYLNNYQYYILDCLVTGFTKHNAYEKN